jgi:PPOX class probable F420-dependent enzyme
MRRALASAAADNRAQGPWPERWGAVSGYAGARAIVPSRREQIEMTDAEVRAFLDERMVMQCATLGPRGLPHMVPLWFVRRGEELIGWTYAKSQKARNLERDARATLGVEDGVQYHELRGVMLECEVEIERETAAVEGYGLALYERYAGGLGSEIRDLVAGQARKRLGLRFVPSRVVSWDHRKLGGLY